MKNLPRILQIIWLIIGAVSIFEAYMAFTAAGADKNTGFVFCIVAVFALFRYVMLRRKQFLQDKKEGKFQ